MFSPTTLEAAKAQVGTGIGRILIVDDNNDSADMFEMLLSSLGYVVKTAYGGESGIALVDTFRPDLVLCDLGMPGVDGYDVARAVRGRPHLSETGLVAVSAWDDPLTLARVARAGFDSHLVKPVQYDLLRAVLESHLCRRTVSNEV